MTNYDLAVIGGGPGGYVAAIRAAQLGMSVVMIEKRKSLGGTCLNEGCIPSKALLQSTHKWHEVCHDLKDHGIQISDPVVDLGAMMHRKNQVVENLVKGIDFLFKKNKIQVIQGVASFKDANTLTVEGHSSPVKAKKVIIATGSVPTSLPNIAVDETMVVTSTGALDLKEIPKKMIIIGGGYIGLEMGSVWSRLGTEVTVVEYLDAIVPSLDREVATCLYKSLKEQGIKFKLSHGVTGFEKKKKALKVKVVPASGGEGETMTCDVLLSCAGRQPLTQGLNLEAIGVACDERGFIQVDGDYQTSCPNVFAIGDVVGGAMLAHKAEEEGVVAVERMTGQKSSVHYGLIPAVIYTMPEVATVGQTEESLKASKTPYCVGKFPFTANSRARASGNTKGIVKILSHKETDEVLGVHIVHELAGTMIAEAVAAMSYRASSEDIARICHAHPTHSEAVKEAALSLGSGAIHM